MQPLRSFRLPALAPVLLLVAILLPGANGCVGSGGAHPSAIGEPASVTFTDFRAPLRMSIVNETHTGRVELYSRSVRASQATTKVATDDVMDALLDRMASKGFFKHTAQGSAPSAGGELIAQALEIQTREGTVHMALPRGAGDDASTRAFREARAAFLSLHGNLFQAQSIELAPEDGPLFKTPRAGGSGL